MRKWILILFITCACVKTQAQVGIITTLAGTGTAGFSGDGGPASNALLNNPNQLCLDKFGNLYIADPGSNRIRKIVLTTGIITTIAGNGVGGYNGDNILATRAQLFVPDAIYTDTSGDVYIGDALNHRIRKVTVETGIITTIAGTGVAGNSGDGGQATDAKIYTPAGLYIDESDNIYIADIDNNTIRKIAPDGIITTIAGNGTLGYSGDGGPAINAQFSASGKAVVDHQGNVIVADGYNHVLRKVDATTGVITTIAGNGTAGYSGDGGAAISATLCNPYGIFIDKQNNILFAEYCSGTIRKIDGVTGVITTIAGCGTAGYSGDGGPATNAKLIPEDLVIDSNGIMYIADYENNRIRKVVNEKLAVPAVEPKEFASIYPNPALNELIIENAAGSLVRIYNLIGQELLSCSIRMQKENIYVERLIPGTYIVNIISMQGLLQIARITKE